MKKYTIAILGVGGVGGYIGGKLAAAQLSSIRVVFIARGQTLDVVRRDGLKLITDEATFIVHPDIISDDPELIGPIDLLVCSVKGYDLRDSLLRYRSCITSATNLLPLLNGIGIADKVRAILPGVSSWEGLIYIVARQVEKGIVKQTGALREIIFGSQAGTSPGMQRVAGIFGEVGLKATVSTNIELELWRKFLFISVMATLTSFYHSPIGDIRLDAVKAANIPLLVHELQSVAVANGIPVNDQLVAAVLERINGLAAGTTTSMYADYQRGGNTEVEELTGDVIRLGGRLGVPTPVYTEMYKSLTAKREPIGE
ncbi:MAG TPA: 2-dehydropantoate 2-reductase [Puia sp.]|jgi:2-dehydropantoate 2-reductase|nr:2-dehydropantoate 2-reductase [Puia sp.]